MKEIDISVHAFTFISTLEEVISPKQIKTSQMELSIREGFIPRKKSISSKKIVCRKSQFRVWDTGYKLSQQMGEIS